MVAVCKTAKYCDFASVNEHPTWAVNSSGKLFVFSDSKFINYEQPPVNAYLVRTIGGTPCVLAQTTGNVYFLANQTIP